MPYEVCEFPGYTEYNVTNGYESGMDVKCPCCGARVEMSLPENGDGFVQFFAACPKCGKDLTFNYYLDNVIAE